MKSYQEGITWFSDILCCYWGFSPCACCVAYKIMSIMRFSDIFDSYLQLEACTHTFFDELRDPKARLPNGRPLPPLFNFRPQGLIIPSQCF